MIPIIKVIGIGGSGCNAIFRMIRSNIKGVELIAVNCDIQDLKKVKAHQKIRIGKNLTKGLGAGMNPEIGKKSAEEQKQEISEVLKGADMVFIVYGLGGGTGTGAGPIVAEIAKNSGALTVAVVTKPFSFEGSFRQKIAETGLKELKGKTDALISIQNDKLLEILEPKISVLNAFWTCDEILRQAVQAISDLVFAPGIINIDFADLKTIIKDSGRAIFGIGKAQGEKRGEKAALAALSPLLTDQSIKGAKRVLFNISAGRDDITFSEINEIAKIITKEVSVEAKIIFGAIQDEKLKKGEIKIALIAAEF